MPITSAEQTRWSAQVGYADHPFSCAVSCAQLAQRACNGDDGRSAGCRGGGSGRAAGGREGGWELLAGGDREVLVGVGEVPFDGPGGDGKGLGDLAGGQTGRGALGGAARAGRQR